MAKWYDPGAGALENWANVSDMAEGTQPLGSNPFLTPRISWEGKEEEEEVRKRREGTEEEGRITYIRENSSPLPSANLLEEGSGDNEGAAILLQPGKIHNILLLPHPNPHLTCSAGLELIQGQEVPGS